VDAVLARLDEHRVSGTPLQREWSLLQSCDEEERDFARAAARLGLDPFSIDDAVAEQIVTLSSVLDGYVLSEFLDSADPADLLGALEWLRWARRNTAAQPPGTPIESVVAFSEGQRAEELRPWEVGYDLARRYRDHLELSHTDALDPKRFVGVRTTARRSAGIDGLVISGGTGVGLMLHQVSGQKAQRFAAARALGLSLLQPDRGEFLLDPTPTELTKASRAFAAEFLAPAQGISEYLAALPNPSRDAIDAIARRFNVSPEVVRRQHENQIVN